MEQDLQTPEWTTIPPLSLPKSGERPTSEQVSRQKRWNIIAKQIGREYSDKKPSEWIYYGHAQDAQRREIAVFREYCRALKEHVSEGCGLLFCGPKGTGKDFLLTLALKHAVLDHGMFAKWVNGVDLYTQMRATMSPNAQTTEAELLAKLTTIPILAISDPLPPMGNLTEFQSSTLFAVIDARYRAKIPTWATINALGVKSASDRMGSQLVDRLRHHAVALECNWESYREFERKKGA